MCLPLKRRGGGREKDFRLQEGDIHSYIGVSGRKIITPIALLMHSGLGRDNGEQTDPVWFFDFCEDVHKLHTQIL